MLKNIRNADMAGVFADCAAVPRSAALRAAMDLEYPPATHPERRLDYAVLLQKVNDRGYDKCPGHCNLAMCVVVVPSLLYSSAALTQPTNAHTTLRTIRSTWLGACVHDNEDVCAIHLPFVPHPCASMLTVIVRRAGFRADADTTTSRRCAEHPWRSMDRDWLSL